jgi:hypothetical protein
MTEEVSLWVTVSVGTSSVCGGRRENMPLEAILHLLICVNPLSELVLTFTGGSLALSLFRALRLY